MEIPIISKIKTSMKTSNTTVINNNKTTSISFINMSINSKTIAKAKQKKENNKTITTITKITKDIEKSKVLEEVSDGKCILMGVNQTVKFYSLTTI